MSIEGEVTFVGGKAVEQTTAVESQAPADEREAAIAAVREALKGEGEKAAKEAKEALERDPLNPKNSGKKSDKASSEEEVGAQRDANGRFLPKEARNSGEEGDQVVTKPDAKKPAEKAKAEDDAASLKRVLTERKELAAKKQAQMDEARQVQEQTRQMMAELQRERQAIAQERAKYEALRKDPARAIREIGMDPEEFILDLARDGTPEGQAMRQQRELQRQLKEIQEWKENQAKTARQQQEHFEAQKAAKMREYVEHEYTKIALSEERYPHVASLFGKHPRLAIALGDVIAEEYNQLSGRTASFEDIASYLDELVGGWYSSRSGSQQGSVVAKTLQGPGNGSGQSTQGAVTGRTLNPSLTSERRTLGTVLKDLDGEERLAAAREAVGAAIRAVN